MLFPKQAPSFPQGSSGSKTYWHPHVFSQVGQVPGEHRQDQPVSWEGQRPEQAKGRQTEQPASEHPSWRERGDGGPVEPTGPTAKLHVPVTTPFPMQEGCF